MTIGLKKRKDNTNSCSSNKNGKVVCDGDTCRMVYDDENVTSTGSVGVDAKKTDTGSSSVEKFKTGTMIQLKDDDEYHRVVQTQSSYDGVFLFFTGEWCAKCKPLIPVFEQLAGINKNCLFCLIDVSEVPDAEEAHEVVALPHFLELKTGEHFVGAYEDKLRELVEMK